MKKFQGQDKNASKDAHWKACDDLRAHRSRGHEGRREKQGESKGDRAARG